MTKQALSDLWTGELLCGPMLLNHQDGHPSDRLGVFESSHELQAFRCWSNGDEESLRPFTNEER